MLLPLAAAYNWDYEQMDVLTAVLHPPIDNRFILNCHELRHIWSRFPIQGSRERYVCKLIKTLYSIEQAPSACYMNIDGYLLSLTFIRSALDPNLYIFDS